MNSVPRRAVILVAAAMLAAAVPGFAREPVRVHTVVVAFKTHFDIGYTEMARDVIEMYRSSMIDKALEVCDRSRDLPPDQQFVWTLPGWPMAQILGPGQASERRARVEAALRAGRFAIHALPFTTHTESLELEDLVRGLGFSSRLCRELGLELPRDAKMTDVPSHSWVVPTLLRRAGVEFLHLGCNAASSSPEVPPLFWWEGPDGSRLLTMYMASGYGSELRPPADWPYPVWLALIHTGDNQGPPAPEQVQGLLEEARATLPGVEVRLGRLSDFADLLLAERPELPVVRGDMPDTWIHGPMSAPIATALARTTRPEIAAAEALNTLLRIWCATVADTTDVIARAWEQSLLYGEHTWGGALWWIGGTLVYGDAWQRVQREGKHARLEESWQEHSAYIERARDLCEPALAAGLDALARAVAVEGPRIVVFNPLPWARSALVTLPVADGDLAALRPADGTEPVAVAGDDGSITFRAADLPPLGYRTFVPAPGAESPQAVAADRRSATLENEFLRVRLDPDRGAIASLVDKRSGRELVEEASPHGFGQLLYERFDRDQTEGFVRAYVKIQAHWALTELAKPDLPPAAEAPYRAASPRGFALELEESALAVTAAMRAPAGADVPFGVTTRVTLVAGEPWVELEVALHDKPLEPWPEGGWICLPFRVERPTFRLGRLGGVVDPARDIVPGSNHHLYCLNSGMAVFDPQGRGAGLCPIDSPCVSLEQPGLWLYSRQSVPARPRVYVNLFNNQWSTNFRFWNGGSWRSRVRIWAIERYDESAGLFAPSWEARQPARAVLCAGPAGPLPVAQAGLSLARGGVLVTSFGADPEGRGWLLRLWEQAGRAGGVRLELPAGLAAARAQPCDLRGRAIGEAIAVRDGALALPLDAWAPATFLLQPPRATSEDPGK